MGVGVVKIVLLNSRPLNLVLIAEIACEVILEKEAARGQ